MIPRALWIGLLAAVVGILTAPSGRAAAPPRRMAFAVVIGNNRSLGSRRPDLHYADDDAAKYFAILQTIAPGRVALFADFDEDTARLFPDARARAVAPTRSELLRAGRDLVDRVQAASNDGSETDVYFVFAGHGDVDEGTGFIDLADARFTSGDLENWLRAIPFSRAHVILDSCNSFFMFGSRKPGGRYYATPEDALRSLAARLPNVGVFLSTSAEGESFEWSEIQSGVFSHIVRSGLLGAADANGDGDVSYVELAAFVATATADVANPNMRPHVFSRGPGGRDDAPLIAIRGRTAARTVKLSDGAATRVRLRDRQSLTLLDAHEEAGQALVVTLPESWTEGAVLERAAGGGEGAPLEFFAVPAPSNTPTTPASLEPIAPRGEARGPAEIFLKLFTRPFGPRALASYSADVSAAPAPVFGVSREDADRMDLLLGQIEGAEHGQRMLTGAVALSVGVLYGALAASWFALDRSVPDTTKTGADTVGGMFAGLGALSLAYGTYAFARPWAGERMASEYRSALGRGDYARAFALANERLDSIAALEAKQRWVRGIAGGLLVLASAAAIVADEVSDASVNARLNARAFGGAGVLLGATAIASAALIESPIGRLTTVWRRDPSLIHFQPVVTPVAGGATVGLVGRF